MTSHATKSLWAATHEPTSYPKLQGSTKADVVIIGGGITGLTAALVLAEAGKRVVLVEARGLGSGATLGTTAHITEALDVGYAKVETAFGKDAAKLVAASSRTAIEHIAARVDAHSIDCGFERVPGYLYTERKEELSTLVAEQTAAIRAGVRVERATNVPLPFAVAGGIRFDDQAQFHVGRYLDGIARAATSAGARIFENSRVLAVDDGDRCVVHLENGGSVAARAVFFATHTPLNRLLLQTKLAHYQSYAMSFQNVELPRALFWDTEYPYHYLRSVTIDGTPHAVVGGEDHKTGTETNSHVHFDKLAEYAHVRLGVMDPQTQWSSQVIESVDGLPLIGRNSMSKNLYVATGYSGNGMTFGTIGAMLVCDLILARTNPWEVLYEPTRIKAAATGTFLKENTDFPVHLLGDRLEPAASSVASLNPDEGKLVRVKGERLAVYRDREGRLRAVSAVCTHLGCLVKFNDAERTWDCPCHGSRFDTDGAVLAGPAIHPLAQRDVSDSPAQQPVDRADAPDDETSPFDLVHRTLPSR